MNVFQLLTAIAIVWALIFGAFVAAENYYAQQDIINQETN